MLAALLTNLPVAPEPTPPQHARGGGGGHRRRPNEPVIWHDEWLKAQEELTKAKAKPEAELLEVVEKAIETVKATDVDIEQVADAQEAVAALKTPAEFLLEIEYLNILLIACFMIESDKRRRNNIAAMLMLGVL